MFDPQWFLKHYHSKTVFDTGWFLQNQRLLLWFANTKFGKDVLCINGSKSSLRDRKILGILPNAIFWLEDIKWDRANKKPIYLLGFEFRTHAKFAKRLYYSGKPIWKGIHTWDTVIANHLIPHWNLGFDSFGPFYPDADPETNTVDGQIQNQDADYPTARNATAGDEVTDSDADNRYIRNTAGYYIARAFFLYVTSSLGAGSTVISATESLFGSNTVFTDGDNDSAVVVSSSPASNTGLVLGDYDQVGSTSFGSIDLTSWSQSAYNDFTLNANGIANIDVAGISKFALRGLNELNTVAPTGGTHISGKYADQTGTTNDPKLAGVYTPAGAGATIAAYKSLLGVGQA